MGHSHPLLVFVLSRFPGAPEKPDITLCFQGVEADRFREVSDDRPCLCFHPSLQNKEYQLLVIEAMA